MKISQKTWYLFLIFSFISFAIWFKFSYPKFSFIDLSVSKKQAYDIANSFLRNELDVDPSIFRHAVIFAALNPADQYLQKALGFHDELKFFRKHNFELFFWRIRFFQENKEEEYRISVSAATGEVTNFEHIIEASAARVKQSEEEAKLKAMAVLKDRFGFNFDEYEFYRSKGKKFDNRMEYSFSWEKRVSLSPGVIKKALGVLNCLPGPLSLEMKFSISLNIH